MLQKNSQSSQAPTIFSKKQTKKLFFYFNYLDERFHFNKDKIGAFKNNWGQIPQANFTPKSFAQIIYKTAIHLHNPTFHCDERGKILSHVRSHIDEWLEPTFDSILAFNNQGKAISLWSLAVLDSHYNDDSLKDAYHTIRKHTHLNKQSDSPILKQVRDADLWFTGKSNIPAPKRGARKRPLILENHVKDAFTRTGFETYRDVSPIPQLKQSIDFSIKDVFQNKIGTLDVIDAEVEGKFHYLNLDEAIQPSDLKYNAHTYFRRALQRRLTKPDFTILCVDAITSKIIERLHLSKNPDDKEKMELLCSGLFEEAVKRPGGVYKTMTDKPEIMVPVNHHDRNLELAMNA